MPAHILITGGAGFIGSHLADELLRAGYRVRALDNLTEQVHGSNGKRPSYVHPDVELLVGDTRDPKTVKNALRGIDAVYHLAAMVGVGQSMYEVSRYTYVNNVGTAVLLEALIENPVERLIVASSMSVYGEGRYQAPDGDLIDTAHRTREQLRSGRWEPHRADGTPLRAIPTPEEKAPRLESVYALTKYDQERLCLMTGQAYEIPTVALRFFNVFGTRQALSNPYTGVLAIFASRLLNGQRPIIFEDGRQRRDFVSVHDVARACRLALETPDASGRVFNIGSGSARTVLDVAHLVAEVLGRSDLKPEITGKYRVGDIRHCFADISLARQVLAYEPKVSLEEGIDAMASWLSGQVAMDHTDAACAELLARGLAV